jgi:hypothetical protein
MAELVEVIKVMQRRNENGRKRLVDAGKVKSVNAKFTRRQLGDQGYVLVSDWNGGDIHNIKDYKRDLSEIQFNPRLKEAEKEVMNLASENEMLRKQLAEMQAKEPAKSIEEKDPIVVEVEVPEVNISAVEAELQERIQAEQEPAVKTRKPRTPKAE